MQHLFYVSLGLESQVVGDMQILKQVKKAYQWIADANMAGPFLHRPMYTIFYSNQQVFNQISFFDSATSVSYAMVERVEVLARYTKKLGAEEKELVETITKNILNKIVELPVLELKAACQRGKSEALLGGLSALFNLEEKQEA